MLHFKADLHVHTVLSPCAQVEMIPPIIVRTALNLEINLIAITDHNTTHNISAVQAAASGTSLTVLPGIEVQTREDVHILCLFDSLDQTDAYQQIVDNALPRLKNDPEHFGEQYVVDSTGEFIRSEERLLLVSTALTIDEAIRHAHDLDGLAIPAHINRQAFGLIPTLGFIPPNLRADAYEITRWLTPESAHEKYPELGGCPIIVGSDAHHPSEMLGNLHFEMKEPTIQEIKLALAMRAGRKFELALVSQK